MRGREYKSRVSKMHLKLRDQQLKTSAHAHTCVCVCIYIHKYIHIYRLLYKNLMVMAKQKFTIVIHTKRKNESKQH